jgi:glycosyltransferase involved in cell wall biosynthesis
MATANGTAAHTDSNAPGICISVVVPTRNRPHDVLRAVSSALNQTQPPHEVIVVVDGPDAQTTRILDEIEDPRLVVVELADNGGPSRARNIGTHRSTGDWIAYLDDDDEWLPDKLRAQSVFVAAANDPKRMVLATRVEWRGDSTVDHWPLRTIAPQESVTDYLFVRRRPGEGILHTSTIMLRRELATACPFPEHLRIHEDYDWFISLQQVGAVFTVILETHAIYNAPRDRASLSSNAKWQISLAWALSRKAQMSERAFSDFCLTSVARLARGTGIRTQIAILSAASTGRLSLFPVSRFLAICLAPDGASRFVAARIPFRIRRPHSVTHSPTV